MTSPWITCRKERPASELRLFCFPYAGASGSVYRPWATQLPEWCEACPIEPPGRWARLREPAFVRIDALVLALSDALAPFFDKPFAFFGYSVGALVAFELARYLRKKGQPAPRHLFVAARRAPQLGQVALHPTV